MNLLKQIVTLFQSTSSMDRSAYWLSVKCNRCGEVVRARIDLNNELSTEYGEGGETQAYICRKVLIGEQLCFQPLEVTLKFDADRKLSDRQVNGGLFVD